MIAPHSSVQNDTSLRVVDDTKHSFRTVNKVSRINTNSSKTLRSHHHLPIKKRCFHEMMNDSTDDSNINDMGSCCCDPPPTKLRRLVASYWNNNNDHDHNILNRYAYDTTIGSTSTITHKDESKQFGESPNWKEITKRPPSSGSYIYNETYGEEYTYYVSHPTSEDTDDDMHRESHQIHTYDGIHASKKKEVVPMESCIPTIYTSPSSPSNIVKQPVELSFESCEDDMDKKPAALVHYPKDVHLTKYNEYVEEEEEEEEESIALAPLGPSRRTTAAHDALFSMSHKPVSLEKGVKIQGNTTTTTTMSSAKISMEHLSIPLTKLSRKDNSFRLGHDSMSYSTDETDQMQRPLPYLSVGMLPKQPPNLLSDTDDEEELLLLTNALPSPATTTVGLDSGDDHGISLPSVTPSPNVVQQQQFVLKERKQAPSSSTGHKLHRTFHTINTNVIRPTPLKAPPPTIKIEKDVVECDFLNQVGNLLSPNTSITERRYNAFQPVTKRSNYRALHNIISEMVHIDSPSNTKPNLHPPMETTPIRRTPKTTYKSPFKPISLKEYDQRIYSDQKGVSTNGKSLPSIPRFTPTPTKPNSLHEQFPSAMMNTSPQPLSINDGEEESMEWEHPLRPAATPTAMMMMTDVTPTPPHPQYDIHFTLHGPSKIGPPVPSEVVVVPTTYMTTTTCSSSRKSDSISIPLTPSKALIHHLPSPKVMSSKSIVSSKVTKPIHQIYASQVHTTGVLPTTKGKPWTSSSHNTAISNSSHPSTPGHEIPTKTRHSTTYRRMTKTPYVPPAPIEEHRTNLEWDGMMMNTRNHHTIQHPHPPSNQLPELQRHVASAFAPGQRRRGYDEDHHHHHSWMDTPQDEYSSPNHHHHKATNTTNTTIINNNITNTNTGGPVLEAMTAMQYNFRNENHNNCMSSCSNSTSGGGSSSNSNNNSSTGPGHHHHHHHQRSNDYEKYEA